MRGKAKSAAKSAVKVLQYVVSSMSSTDVASPAAAMLERRPSRTTQEKRKQPCGDSESEGPETGSDGEWSGDDDPLSDHGR